MVGYQMYEYHHLQFFLSKTKLNIRKVLCAIALTGAHPPSCPQVLYTARAEDELSSSSELCLSANTTRAGLKGWRKNKGKDTGIFSTTANSKSSLSLFSHRTLQVKGRRRDIHFIVPCLPRPKEKTNPNLSCQKHTTVYFTLEIF